MKIIQLQLTDNHFNSEFILLIMGKKDIILAIDPAELCGWACSDGTNGLWNLSLKRDENKAMKLVKFQSLLEQFIIQHKVDIIVYEAVSGRMPNAIMSHSKYICIIELLTEKYNLPCKGYHAKSIKKFATGNGNASKKDMVKHAIKYYGYRGTDDNTADALAILHFAKFDIFNEI